jgi:cytoskeletal protein RodZ
MRYEVAGAYRSLRYDLRRRSGPRHETTDILYPEYDAYEPDDRHRRAVTATGIGLVLAGAVAGVYFVVAGGMGVLVAYGSPATPADRPSAPASPTASVGPSSSPVPTAAPLPAPYGVSPSPSPSPSPSHRPSRAPSRRPTPPAPSPTPPIVPTSSPVDNPPSPTTHPTVTQSDLPGGAPLAQAGQS